jgi:hypothetical protein
MATKAYMAIRRTAGFFAVALFVAGLAISVGNAQESQALPRRSS